MNPKKLYMKAIEAKKKREDKKFNNIIELTNSKMEEFAGRGLFSYVCTEVNPVANYEGIPLEEERDMYHRVLQHYKNEGFDVEMSLKPFGLKISWANQQEEKHWKTLTAFNGKNLYSKVGFDEIWTEYEEFKKLPEGVVTTVLNELEKIFDGEVNEFELTGLKVIANITVDFLRKAGYNVEIQEIFCDNISITNKIKVKKEL